MPKNAFQKMCRHQFYLVFGHCTGKSKDISLKFCMRVVCMSITYIPFSKFPHVWKISQEINFFVEKSQDLEIFLFWKFEIAVFFARLFFIPMTQF